MIKDIIHVGISVRNLEDAKKFYGDVLGLKFTEILLWRARKLIFYLEEKIQ